MMSFLSGLALLFGLFSPLPQAGIVCVSEGNGCIGPGSGLFINNGPALNGQHTRPTSEILPEGGIQLRVQSGQLLAIR